MGVPYLPIVITEHIISLGRIRVARATRLRGSISTHDLSTIMHK
jgi:hypothetical protein